MEEFNIKNNKLQKLTALKQLLDHSAKMIPPVSLK